MRFTKMHGLGNDYVYVDCFTETVDDPAETPPEAVAGPALPSAELLGPPLAARLADLSQALAARLALAGDGKGRLLIRYSAATIRASVAGSSRRSTRPMRCISRTGFQWRS